MKNIIQALLLIAIVVVSISCTRENDTPTINSPVIEDFSPITGEPGVTIVITGRNFRESITENLVTFAGTPAEITSASATELMVKVPTAASTGRINLISNNITVTSGRDFTVITSGSPVITSFAPAEGRAGAQVIITGSNFSSVIAENKVAIGNQSATVVSASATELKVIVPSTASSAKISVKVNGLSTTSASLFVVIAPPAVDSFYPAGGPAGSSVSFFGTQFSTKPGGNIVKFNNIEAEITEVSASKITAKVPVGAQTGKVNLIVDGVSLFTTTNFTVTFAPVINSITPLQGSPGMSITILGENFNSTFTGMTSVVFADNVLANIISYSDNQIIVTVPSGTVTGKISVVANQLTKTSLDIFEILPATISTFTSHGGPRTSITINGSNFSTISASDNIVKINGMAATVTAFSDRQLTVLVPVGATSGKISVEVAGNIATSTTDFTVD